MVLQVLADAGQVTNHRHAVAAQQIGRADARQLQQLWRLDRAGGQQHLGAAARRLHHAALAVAHADGAAVLDDEAGGLRLGLDAQVYAAARRLQVGLGGAAAPALRGGELVARALPGRRR